MTPARHATGGQSVRIGLGVLLVAVLGVVLLLRPGSGGAGRQPPESAASPTGVLPTATPATAPSEEAFCQGYRRLAAAQGQYAAQPDGPGAELLRGAADDLLAIGVPDSMQVPARTGYFVEISGIYASLGTALDRRAVPGAGEADGGTSVSGVVGEFGVWLNRLCPAW